MCSRSPSVSEPVLSEPSRCVCRRSDLQSGVGIAANVRLASTLNFLAAQLLGSTTDQVLSYMMIIWS